MKLFKVLTIAALVAMPAVGLLAPNLAAADEPVNPTITSFNMEVVTQASFVFNWTTDIGTDAEVRANTSLEALEQTQWGRLDAYNASTTYHRMVYFGLTPNTHYYYQLRSSVPGGGSVTRSGDVTTLGEQPTIGAFHVEVVTQTSYVLNWTTNIGTDAEARSATSPEQLQQTPWGRVDQYSSTTTYHRMVWFGLNPGTRYYYEVRSSVPGGGSVTRSGDVTTLGGGQQHEGQEVRTTMLTIRVVSPTELRVTWDADRDAVWQVGYAVGSNPVQWQPTGSYQTATPNHTAQITGLQPNTTYGVQLKVVSAGFWSQIDNGVMTVSTGDPSMVNSEPIVTNLLPGSATITWTSNLSGYNQVFFATQPWQNSYGMEAAGTIGAFQEPLELRTQHAVNLVGLRSNTTYYYRISTHNPQYQFTGHSGLNVLRSFTTTGAGQGGIAISNVAVSDITQQGATVRWTTNIPADTAVAYATREFTSEQIGPLGVVVVGDASQTPVTEHVQALSGLQPGTRYFYRVRSTTVADRAPHSSLRNFVTLRAAGTQPPSEPVPAGETARERELQEKVKKLQLRVSELELQVVELEKRLMTKVDARLTERLKGKILLQVEENGEAWYVDPETGKKFFLKDGQSAYDFLRLFGLGIKTSDLQKIPVGIEPVVGEDSDGDGLDDKLEIALGTNVNAVDSDGDGHDDKQEVAGNFNPNGSGVLSISQNLTGKLEGQILLQVEDRGQAWYVVNGKRYYLKDGQAAYELMRKKSLGIKNSDLRKIDVGTLE